MNIQSAWSSGVKKNHTSVAQPEAEAPAGLRSDLTAACGRKVCPL